MRNINFEENEESKIWIIKRNEKVLWKYQNYCEHTG